MSRPPDPTLEDRILTAASRLWKIGGEKALTLRAVAVAAGSNTPAVYRRFRDRDAILRALLQRTKLKLFKHLKAASTVEDACERYVNFAVRNPHEYQLYYLHEHRLFASIKPPPRATLNQVLQENRPVVDFMKGKLAAQLGGDPDRHTHLVLSLWAMLHGTATLLIGKTILPQHAAEMREACRTSVEILLREDRRSPTKVT